MFVFLSLGSLVRILVDVIWFVIIVIIVVIGMCKFWMYGMFFIMLGLMVMWVICMFIRLVGDSMLGWFFISCFGLSLVKSKLEGDFGIVCGVVLGGDVGVVVLVEGVDDG